MADFQKAMTAFPASAHLDDDEYRRHVLDNMLNPEETHQLRIAGIVIHKARTLDDLAPATTALANVVKSAGLSFTEKALDAAARSASNTTQSFSYANVGAADSASSGLHVQLAQEFLPFSDDLIIGRIPEWIRKLPQAIRDRPMSGSRIREVNRARRMYQNGQKASRGRLEKTGMILPVGSWTTNMVAATGMKGVKNFPRLRNLAIELSNIRKTYYVEGL